MIATFLIAASLGQCPNGVCAAQVARVATIPTRTVQKVVQTAGFAKSTLKRSVGRPRFRLFNPNYR